MAGNYLAGTGIYLESLASMFIPAALEQIFSYRRPLIRRCRCILSAGRVATKRRVESVVGCLRTGGFLLGERRSRFPSLLSWTRIYEYYLIIYTIFQ